MLCVRVLLPALRNKINYNAMNNNTITASDKRIVAESKIGIKTRNFSTSNSVAWNLKRRFR